ncbi:MAG TPA: hypothetical protein VGN27_02315, partial [Gaiellaceae bacterium]|nr:hypothetical protein [Gaiellaceae bacterium]
MERLGALARDLPEEVGLRLDVRVERAFLEPERLGEIADGRAVVALLGEEPGSGSRQLGLAGGDTITLTIVRSQESAWLPKRIHAMSRPFSSTSRPAARS